MIVCTHVCGYAGQSTTWYGSLRSYQFYFHLFFSKRARETDINRRIQRHKQTDWLMDTDTGWLTELELASQPWEPFASSSVLRLQGCSNAFIFLFYELWMMELRSSLPTKLLPHLFKPKRTNSFRSTVNNFIWLLNYTQAENPHTNQVCWMGNSEQMSHSYAGDCRDNLPVGLEVP